MNAHTSQTLLAFDWAGSRFSWFPVASRQHGTCYCSELPLPARFQCHDVAWNTRSNQVLRNDQFSFHTFVFVAAYHSESLRLGHDALLELAFEHECFPHAFWRLFSLWLMLAWCYPEGFLWVLCCCCDIYIYILSPHLHPA